MPDKLLEKAGDDRMRLRPPPVVSGAIEPDGHFAEYTATPIRFLHRAHAECGEVAEFDVAGLKTVLMVGPEAQEAFFRAPEEQLNAAAAYQMMVPIFGTGIQYGAEHEVCQQQLRIQQRGLRFERMKGYVPVVVRETKDFIGDWGDEGKINAVESFRKLTMRTSTHCLLGTHLRYRMTDEFTELYADLEKGIDPAALRDYTSGRDAFTKRDIARTRLQQLLTEAVEERRATGEATNDMLQEYMTAHYRNGKALTEHEITGMVIWFMFAGHHTSSTTATWTLIEIARHPEYLERLRQEVDAVYGKHAELDFQALRELPLLEGFIRESLRLHPPLNALTRRVLQDFVYKDWMIEKGKNVTLCPHVSHRLPEIFPDPERFDPERPEPDNPYALIAFGGGRHRCIGNAFAILQISAILCTMLRDYEFELTEDAAAYEEHMPTLLLLPVGPANIRYRRRKR